MRQRLVRVRWLGQVRATGSEWGGEIPMWSGVVRMRRRLGCGVGVARLAGMERTWRFPWDAFVLSGWRDGSPQRGAEAGRVLVRSRVERTWWPGAGHGGLPGRGGWNWAIGLAGSEDVVGR